MPNSITYKGPRTQLFISIGPFFILCFGLLSFIFALFTIDCIFAIEQVLFAP